MSWLRPANRDWVVLDGAEPAEEVEHCVASSFERPRRREQLARDEKAARSLGGDLHGPDAIQPTTADF